MTNKMTNKIEEFKKIFLQKQQEIVKSQESRTDEIDTDGADEIDIVQSNLIKAMVDKLSLRDKQALSKIRNALIRIESGIFGKCIECEEEIGEKRLEALPYCELCVSCQEQEERFKKQHRAQ